jgi:hypothetical protein
MGVPYALLTGDAAEFFGGLAPAIEKPFESAAVLQVVAQLLCTGRVA